MKDYRDLNEFISLNVYLKSFNMLFNNDVIE